MSATPNERFSGHESFVCRYGWLPKVHRAVQSDPAIIKNEEGAMQALGIGRNMVKSLQFWAESAGVIGTNGQGGHTSGPLGSLLLACGGRDPHLESLESLWLIHWRLSTNANMAAWNLVFGEAKLIRFERTRLIAALADRGAKLARALAPSTLEQHASILINSYLPSARSGDDTSWCPLQDLGVLKASKTEDGRTVYSTDVGSQIGLTPRAFAIALVDYVASHGKGEWTVDLHSVLKGEFSPGLVFRLDEYQLREFIQACVDGVLKNALRFVDTADTQSLVLQPEELSPEYRAWAKVEAQEYV
ncbi:DUF4007 family protein [Pseudomonas sp.]|uniref:DUF4007 family protein n=1 Tax=Pseudomonas sp. TaxID=306 RepID=UPI0026092D7C|nr:DUF4007 family protein [Pseudomonas sp.]